MFSGSFDIWHWLIVLVIVIAIFGTKKLANAGSDLGAAVRNFKKAMRDGENEAEAGKKASRPDTEDQTSPGAERAEMTHSDKPDAGGKE